MKFKLSPLFFASIVSLASFTMLLSAKSVDTLASARAAAVVGSLPTFADYPAKGKFNGKPAKAKIKTKDARMYRTAITEGAKEGPNFAGHYTIVTWGCGTGCAGFAIVDANTGAVYMPPFYMSYGHQLNEDLQNREMLDYQLGSNLLIVTGSRNETNQGQYFYIWDGKRLKLIRTEFEVRD